MDSLLQGILDWVPLHPYLAGLLVFCIALLESLIVIGLLIPGAFLLFGAGALIATGNLPLVPILLWTIGGAIAGDTISFLIGRHYHQRLRVMWPLRRYPAMVNRGTDFFFRHGGKSVFMARFVGPVRPIVPAIAGMMEMPVARFLGVDVVASVLWAPAYILPGMVFGASLGLAAEVAGRLVVLLIVIAGVTWLSVELIRGITRLLQPPASVLLDRLLDWSRNHPRIKPLTGSLLDPAHPEARGLATLAVLLFFTLWGLLLISRQELHGRFMASFDVYLFHALQTLRTPWADRLMVFITQFGQQLLLAAILAGGCLWLFRKGRSRAAWHWLAAYAGTGILTWVLKVSAQVARPVDWQSGFSFPSAHVSMSLAVFGFLALLVARELPYRNRWLPYSTAAVAVTAIAFSRLYLGVHWFSDVLGAATLGIFWVALLGIAYDHHPAPRLHAGGLVAFVLLVTIVAGSLQVQQRFGRDLTHYLPRPDLLTVTRDAWQEDIWQLAPPYRIDLEGSPKQPMNVQWAGDLGTLQALLEARGWRLPTGLGAASFLNLLTPEPSIGQLPILPQVHDGLHPELVMVTDPAHNEGLTVLRLWLTRMQFATGATPVWLGNVSTLFMEQTPVLLTILRTDRNFDAPLRQLRRPLGEDVESLLRQRPVESLPGDIAWDGTVLLASEPGK
jgi:undecaprenyl-diphosphatase